VPDRWPGVLDVLSAGTPPYGLGPDPRQATVSIDSTIRQDLVLFDVQADPAASEVYVDIYGGGREAICGSVRFSFPVRGDWARNVGRLRRWQRERAILTMVDEGKVVRLIDDRAVLAEVFDLPTD
jgi:hypothetical protein